MSDHNDAAVLVENSLRTKLTMARPVSPSSEAVGSSKMRMSGRLTIARAIATRCCSPPLNFTGGNCAGS